MEDKRGKVCVILAGYKDVYILYDNVLNSQMVVSIVLKEMKLSKDLIKFLTGYIYNGNDTKTMNYLSSRRTFARVKKKLVLDWADITSADIDCSEDIEVIYRLLTARGIYNIYCPICSDIPLETFDHRENTKKKYSRKIIVMENENNETKQEFPYIITVGCSYCFEKLWNTLTDCVRIYYSDNAQTLTFGLHRRIVTSHAKFELSKVNMAIKNAIDCQILFDIKNISKANKNLEIYIISMDSDFDKPIEDFKNLGLKIKKLTQVCEVYGAVVPKPKSTKNKPSTATVRLDKREQKIRSIYGTYFKIGIYKDKRDQIVKILARGKSRLQINNELNKIIPGENVSEILKQFKPLLSELPGK